MKEYFNLSETRMCKALFPELLNANNTLFGGKAMQWMDEVAYISATRFTRQRMFTAHTGNIRFLKAVTPNSIIEIVGCVVKAEAVRLTIKVEIFVEDMYSHKRDKAIEGDFVMIALNAKDQPQRIDYSYIEEQMSQTILN